MIKIILSIYTTVLLLTFFSVLFFWRDTTYNPNLNDFIDCFLVLPLLLTVTVLSPYFMYKGWKHYQKKQMVNAQESVNKEQEKQSIKANPVEVRQFQLNIFSAEAWHNFGENETILEEVKQFNSPTLDPYLCNTYGLPILSFRIQSLDERLELEDTEEISMTMREKRIEQLLIHQINKHSQTLLQVSNHLNRSAMYYDSALVDQYRMHPAWMDSNHNINETMDDVCPSIEPIAKLNRLNIHVFLPENLVDYWNNFLHQRVQEICVEDYSLLSTQMVVECHFVHHKTAYSTLLELLDKISQQEHEFSFIINLDSEIDQKWLDERRWQTEHYIPAEFASSWCLCTDKTKIFDLEPLKTLNIILNEEYSCKFLQNIQPSQLAQFEQNHPFVLFLDDINDNQISQKLHSTFAETAIQTHHFLYLKQNFGHTQHLAQIFSFMLGIHLPEDVIGMVYSVEHASTYAYFEASLDKNMMKN